MLPDSTAYLELEDLSSSDQERLLDDPAAWQKSVRNRLGRKQITWSIAGGLATVVMILLVWSFQSTSFGLGIESTRWDSPWRVSSKPRITIFQHFNLHNDRIRELQRLSMSQHQRYAHFWGYQYRTSAEQFVPEANTTVRQRQMNKVYGLLQIVLDEVARGDQGADWIHITDADVLIADPSVPIHALLPDDDLREVSALIVGSEDGNGFNSGNMLYRCDLDLVAYLAHTIAISHDITEEYEEVMRTVNDDAAPKDIETPPSDQRALCLVLEQNDSFASRFFQYPQKWLNSYDLRKEDSTDIQLHTHLVAGRKYRAEYNDYELAEKRGWDWVNSRTGIQLELRVQEVTGISREYWKSAKIGLPKCIWV